MLVLVLIFLSCDDKQSARELLDLVTTQLNVKIVPPDSIYPPLVHSLPIPEEKKLFKPQPIYKKEKERTTLRYFDVQLSYAGSKKLSPSDKKYPASYTANISPVQAKVPIRIPINNRKNKVAGNTLTLDRDDGIPVAYSGGLFQDEAGAIWGCSRHGGIWKYDGSQIFHYDENVGLPDYSVVNLYIDSEGDIWIGMSIGLIHYDGHSMTNYSKNGSISPHKPTKIVEDQSGHIWVGSNEGIYIINKTTRSITHLNETNGLMKDEVSSMLIDDSGKLWVTYNKLGFSRIHVSNVANKLAFEFTNYTANAYGYRNVQCLHETQDGLILIGTNIGLIVVDPSLIDRKSDGDVFGHSFTSDRGAFVYALAEDRDGNIYQGTQFGLHKIDEIIDGKIPSYISMNDELSEDGEILALLVDQENDLWVSNIRGSINRIDLDEPYTPVNDDYGMSGQMFDIAKDKHDNLWMISGYGLVLCLQAADQNGERTMLDFTDQIGAGNRSLTGMEADQNGNIWISNQKTLVMLNLGRSLDDIIYKKYDLTETTTINQIVDLTIDDDNHIWLADNTLSLMDKAIISSGGGAYKLEENKIYQYGKAQGLVGDDTYSICQDSDGNMWFNSTYRGITKYEKAKNGSAERWIHYDGVEVQKNTFAVMPFFDNGMWFYTINDIAQIPSAVDTPIQAVPLIIQTAKRQSQTNYSNKSFKDNVAFTGFNEHLIEIHRSENKNSLPVFTYEVYNKLDGIFRDNNPAIVTIGDDEIYMRAIKNFYQINPQNLSNKNEIHPVHIQEVRIANEKINWSNEINPNAQKEKLLTNAGFSTLNKWSGIPLDLSLDYRDNYLTFVYNSVNVRNPHKVEYRHYLEGYENEWNKPSSSTIAQYPNLSHGQYKLHLQSRMPNNTWTQESVYSFTIRPPWWHTWWAYIIYLSLVGVIIWALYRYVLSQKMEKAEVQKIKEIDVLKSRLYTNITHEFRTPLTVISGMASQMKNDPDKWFDSGVDMIQRNSTRLLGLVNQMLDLSKLESGKIILQYEQGDIVNYIKYLVESIHSFAESKAIQVHFHSDEESLVMDFDREKILQIITNLISNAVKFTPPNGNVFILLRTNENKGLRNLQITVKDTGIGIAKDQLDFVFDRFYQVDGSSSRSSEGTGLGLAMVRELVLIMNGNISVKSIVGRETEFKILLPITNLARKAAPQKTYQNQNDPNLDQAKKLDTASVYKVSSANVPNTKPTILLVEDNVDVVAYIASCLEQDYHILVGNNGQEGLDIALERTPDLIISDIMMPIMDGFELCQCLKSNLLTSHIPVIMLTAKIDMESKLSGLSIGANAYLAKPFHKEELLVRINSLLDNHKKLQHFYLSKATHNKTDENVTKLETYEPIEDEFVTKVRTLVMDNINNVNLTVDHLCRQMLMSRSQLQRKMSALFGISPKKFINHLRLAHAKELIIDSNETISKIALNVGFEDAGYFGRLFKKEFGITPNECREKKSL